MLDNPAYIVKQAFFKNRYDFGEQFQPQIRKIISANAYRIMKINTASHYEDTRRATDLNITGGGAVGVRMRDANTRYRDFTIRSSAPAGLPSELDKLKDGYNDYYFYGWGKDGGELEDWILIDTHMLKESGLLEKAIEKVNTDGSKFVFLSIDDLEKLGCIIAGNVKGKDYGK